MRHMHSLKTGALILASVRMARLPAIRNSLLPLNSNSIVTPRLWDWLFR